MVERKDAIVLGAGIVGISTAWHLQRRGKSVTLLDRRGPAEETSYGNAGLVERDGFLPMSFPQSLGELLKYAGNTQPQMHYHPSFLPRLAPYLLAMRAGSAPAMRPAYARAMIPLLRRTTEEHRAFAAAAGAEHYFRETAGIRLYRTEAGFKYAKASRDFADQYGVAYQVLMPQEVGELEPNLSQNFHRGVVWTEGLSASSPGGVATAYARQFVKEGGVLARGEAGSLSQQDGLWQVETESGPVAAPVVVLALGPWTADHLRPLGYRLPFAVIRGYHRHFQPVGNAVLGRPVVDVENGFVITPMEKGIRLTTGYEFAARDAAPTPVQIERDLPLARELFPVGEAVDEPWLGRRPCLPDSLPVIGWAPRHKGLFINFGHSHLGFTLGPVTGRLAAEMITGEAPLADPAPFAATRFDRAAA
jgi:D-amino-acid dehydrogenase